MKNPALSKTQKWSAPPEPVRTGGDQQGALTFLTGAAMGSTVTLGSGPSVMGRSPEATVRVEDEGVSRCHARILRSAEGYLIEDLASTNGTFVDGVAISAPVRLQNGTRIQIGASVMRFSLQDTLEQEAARRMYEMSVRDGLTGLYNRRHFEERMSAEYAFAARHRTDLSVLVIDVDHFKSVNDRFGHPAGDAVLRAIGLGLLDSVRSEDLVARLGGEEFVVLCRGIDVAGTKQFAERIRALVSSLRVESGQWTLEVTASVGIAHNRVSGGSRAEQLVASADAALYRAKRAGRDRIEGPFVGGQYAMHGEQSPEHIEALATGAESASQPKKREKREARTWEGATRPTDE